MVLFCGIWQGINVESRKFTGGAYQLTTAAAITDKDKVGRLKKLHIEEF